MAQMSSVEGAEVPPGGPEDEVSIEQQRFLSELGSVLGFDGTPGPHDMGLDSDESSSFYSQKSDSDSEDDAAGEHHICHPVDMGQHDRTAFSLCMSGPLSTFA